MQSTHAEPIFSILAKVLTWKGSNNKSPTKLARKMVRKTLLPHTIDGMIYDDKIHPKWPGIIPTSLSFSFLDPN